MHPFLAAVGPSFHKGVQMKSLQSVDVYPLMCSLLSVPPGPNNGSLNHSRCLLAHESCWTLPQAIVLVVGVLLVLTLITGRFKQFRVPLFSKGFKDGAKFLRWRLTTILKSLILLLCLTFYGSVRLKICLKSVLPS